MEQLATSSTSTFHGIFFDLSLLLLLLFLVLVPYFHLFFWPLLFISYLLFEPASFFLHNSRFRGEWCLQALLLCSLALLLGYAISL